MRPRLKPTLLSLIKISCLIVVLFSQNIEKTLSQDNIPTIITAEELEQAAKSGQSVEWKQFKKASIDFLIQIKGLYPNHEIYFSGPYSAYFKTLAHYVLGVKASIKTLTLSKKERSLLNKFIRDVHLDLKIESHRFKALSQRDRRQSLYIKRIKRFLLKELEKKGLPIDLIKKEKKKILFISIYSENNLKMDIQTLMQSEYRFPSQTFAGVSILSTTPSISSSRIFLQSLSPTNKKILWPHEYFSLLDYYIKKFAPVLDLFSFKNYSQDEKKAEAMLVEGKEIEADTKKEDYHSHARLLFYPYQASLLNEEAQNLYKDFLDDISKEEVQNYTNGKIKKWRNLNKYLLKRQDHLLTQELKTLVFNARTGEDMAFIYDYLDHIYATNPTLRIHPEDIDLSYNALFNVSTYDYFDRMPYPSDELLDFFVKNHSEKKLIQLIQNRNYYELSFIVDIFLDAKILSLILRYLPYDQEGIGFAYKLAQGELFRVSYLPQLLDFLFPKQFVKNKTYQKEATTLSLQLLDTLFSFEDKSQLNLFSKIDFSSQEKEWQAITLWFLDKFKIHLRKNSPIPWKLFQAFSQNKILSLKLNSNDFTQNLNTFLDYIATLPDCPARTSVVFSLFKAIPKEKQIHSFYVFRNKFFKNGLISDLALNIFEKIALEEFHKDYGDKFVSFLLDLILQDPSLKPSLDAILLNLPKTKDSPFLHLWNRIGPRMFSTFYGQTDLFQNSIEHFLYIKESYQHRWPYHLILSHLLKNESLHRDLFKIGFFITQNAKEKINSYYDFLKVHFSENIQELEHGLSLFYDLELLKRPKTNSDILQHLSIASSYLNILRSNEINYKLSFKEEGSVLIENLQLNPLISSSEFSQVSLKELESLVLLLYWYPAQNVSRKLSQGFTQILLKALNQKAIENLDSAQMKDELLYSSYFQLLSHLDSIDSKAEIFTLKFLLQTQIPKIPLLKLLNKVPDFKTRESLLAVALLSHTETLDNLKNNRTYELKQLANFPRIVSILNRSSKKSNAKKRIDMSLLTLAQETGPFEISNTPHFFLTLDDLKSDLKKSTSLSKKQTGLIQKCSYLINKLITSTNNNK